MADLTTLLDVKTWLPIPSTTMADDAKISRLITATSADFMRAVNRPDFLAATYTELREGDGATRIVLRHWPVNTVASLTVGGTTVPAASSDHVTTPGWYIDSDLDPERQAQVYLAGLTFTDAAIVAITYNAGYTAVPGDVAQAVIDWVAYRYKGIPNIGATRRRDNLGDSVAVEEIGMPLTTQSTIDRYRREIPSLSRREEIIAAKPVKYVPKPPNGASRP